MRLAFGLGVAALAAAVLAAAATAAIRLAMPDATERSARYAKRTCAHDPNCVRSGVLNCSRRGLHVVTCRVFDERRTEVQGRYRCDRLIRISLDTRSGRMPVTGLGEWNC